MPDHSPRVGLFVTCLVDMFRPSVGFAAVKLLEDAGCTVEVPQAQTCCGQPAYNSGDQADARALALNVIAAFKGYDYVVAPSGSCGGMIVKHYPEFFEPGSTEHDEALDLARRTHELTSFLTRVLKVEKVEAQFPACATYHDSCSGLRELGIRNEPRKLLASVAQREERQENEPAPGRVAAEDDVPAAVSVGAEPAPYGQRIVERRGVGALRRERIVEAERRNAARPDDMRDEPSVRVRRAREESAAVNVQDKPVLLPGRGADDLRADAARDERPDRHARRIEADGREEAFLFARLRDGLSREGLLREGLADPDELFFRGSRHPHPSLS